MARTGLTPKQQRFVDEYIICMNATEAYQKAYGCSREAADRSGARLLGNVGVATAVQEAMRERSARTGVQADRVLQELACLAHSDIGDILDFAGDSPRLRPASQIPERARRCIASVKVKRQVERNRQTGEFEEVELIEFRLWPKTEALSKAMQHLGLLKESVEHTFPQGVPFGAADATTGQQRAEEYRRRRLTTHHGDGPNAERNGTG